MEPETYDLHTQDEFEKVATWLLGRYGLSGKTLFIGQIRLGDHLRKTWNYSKVCDL